MMLKAKPNSWPHHPTIVCDVSLSSPDQYLATHWPLTLAQPDFSACMFIFFFLFLFFLYRNVTGGREVKQINVKTYLRSIHLRDLFFCLFFCDCFSPCECFKKKKKKTCGISYFKFLLFFHVAFFLPLSVKFTWKLNTGIGTQLCYLVPLAICWLLKKKKKHAYRPLSNTFESLTSKTPLSAL